MGIESVVKVVANLEYTSLAVLIGGLPAIFNRKTGTTVSRMGHMASAAK